MSYEREIALQKADDEAYAKWFMSTPEYWSMITDKLTAKVKSSKGKLTASCKGEIVS